MTGFANHSTTSDFAERLLAISAEDLDGRDRDAVRWLLLDHLGVVANGSTTPSARAASAFVRGLDTSSSFEFPLIGTTEVAPVLHAALVNGVAGHSIEYDDVHNASSSHPGVVVFPAALAAASLANADSQLFLRACLVGYEGMCRVGRAVNPAAHYAAHLPSDGHDRPFWSDGGCCRDPRSRPADAHQRHRSRRDNGGRKHGVPPGRRLDETPPSWTCGP